MSKAATTTPTDLQPLKDAARGQWPAILSALAGIPADSLDGKHHPCLKCGGNDRFRLIDAEAGSILCNGCFREKNGDGIAALQWALGIDFPAAVEMLANHLGIPVPDSSSAKRGRGRPKKSKGHAPDDTLAFRSFAWPVQYWCEVVKAPVTVEAFLAAGGRLALYTFAVKDYCETSLVVALPAFAPPFAAEGFDVATAVPCSWTIWHALGADLPKAGPGGTIERCKCKQTLGSKSGLMLAHGLTVLSRPVDQAAADPVEVVWKTGGPTDALALWSAIPADQRDTNLVITNSSGENENVRPEWVELFRGRKVNVIHDADLAGEVGALKWVQKLAGVASEVRQVKLPYEVKDSHGRDLRDWLGEAGEEVTKP